LVARRLALVLYFVPAGAAGGRRRRCRAGAGVMFQVSSGIDGLFNALPGIVSSSHTGGSLRESRVVEFIAINAERSFSLGPVPIRERTAHNVPSDCLVCLAHRVGAEEGNTPLHNRRVFLWTSRHAIVGCEFGKIRTDDDLRKVAVSVVDQLATRIGTIKIVFE
jgi:hypothetical protein